MDLFAGNPLFTIALILVAGYPAGILARKIGFPGVTGNILAGVLLGPSGLHFFDTKVAHDLQPVTIFAMGLITFVIGGHLNYRRLYSARKRIIAISVIEVILTVVLVSFGAWWAEARWETAVLLGSIAIGTAAATTVAVIREERARGILVKTLLATVALDNVLCILIFSLLKARVSHSVMGSDQTFWMVALEPIREVAFTVGLGVGVGAALIFLVQKKVIEPFSGLCIAILFTSGVAQALDISPLLATLTLGVVVGNRSGKSEGVQTSLESLEPMLLTCFFTLAGVDLHLGSLASMGLIGLAYMVARSVGKVCGGYFGALLAGDSKRVRQNIGPAMISHAGLAIGLVVVLQGDASIPQEIVTVVTNVVLAVVVVCEIVGPPLARRSIHRAGEAGKGRRRIVEFLQEEFIEVPIKADNKSDAIRHLADFLVKSHRLKTITATELVESIEERERSVSTAVGSGVALPHAKIASGPEIMGVMGISPKGIDFGAPDDRPVHTIIMIATPEEHKSLHVQVMGAVARIMSNAEIRAKLLTARSPAEAFEVIDTEETQDYNYFLEE